MLGAARVTPLGEERIAATVHVDGTARAQIADGAGFIGDVLTALGDAGADPVLINTSFNTRGEPIVNTADDAVRSAEALGVDFLVVGDELFDRAMSPARRDHPARAPTASIGPCSRRRHRRATSGSAWS